jgi:hypothetical protein
MKWMDIMDGCGWMDGWMWIEVWNENGWIDKRCGWISRR